MATIADRVKRVVVGRALASHKLEHQLLPKTLALPVFSSDPLSSNAYATEEMMLVLVLAGAGALSLAIPIALLIAVVLAVVVTSYRQTVRAYPRGGGSYIVARENLGTTPGLVAASAILIGYVVTASVSVTAGAAAVTAAAPGLAPFRVPMAIGFLVLIALANLRGVRESGALFAVPTYGFVAIVYVTVLAGAFRCLGTCPTAETAAEPLPTVEALGLVLVLRAFTQGSSALTGVEAIADGVQAFRRPQGKNAAATLGIMAAMSVSMFLGITFLARALQVRVTEEIAVTRTVLSQIGETVFGRGAMFFALQVFTTLILIVAANTAYQDFPRLSAILARDRFVPTQFKNRGDRLVFSNGVIILSVLAALLVWAFDGELTGLIPLYLVSVFTAFTLSQAGMVVRWVRRKQSSWRRNALINAFGATTTGLVLVVGIVTRFREGAWMVITAVPILVALMLVVHRHYRGVRERLRARGLSAQMEGENTVVLIVADVDLATRDAVSWLHAVRAREVIPLYVGDGDVSEAAARWRELAPARRFRDLEPLNVSDRSVRSIRRYVRAIERGPNDFVTVVVPEVLTGRSLVRAILPRSGTRFMLKAGLLFERGVVVVDVPLLPEERAQATARAARSQQALELERNVCIVPVSAVHDASVRAIVYAKSLQPAELQALYLVEDPEDEAIIMREWADPQRRIDVPLALVEAPFRDYGPPFLEEVRRHTARGDTVVTVVLPEFIMRPVWRQFVFHNQTALFFKRLLLFEPRVVVASVPVHLD
ncbi:MAG TPA: APC family permease [Actinomycetota bacterium]|nr:APC family permease [Actinomycetota bacterium]